jgi:methionyl-tRNA formyltransferase
LDGREETGVSVITLDKRRFDAGLLVAQQRVPIERGEHVEPLAARLAERGGALLLDVLRELPVRLAAAAPQHGVASHAPRLSMASGAVRWRDGIARLSRQLRALLGSFGVHATFRGRRTALLDVVPAEALNAHCLAAALALDAPPGAFFYSRRDDLLVVSCGDGALGVRRLVLAGRRAITARQFAAGYQLGRGPAHWHMFDDGQ